MLVKLNVAEADLDRVIAPAAGDEVADGVQAVRRGGGYAVESVVPKSDINVLIPALKDHGATDIIELPISKIVH